MGLKNKKGKINMSRTHIGRISEKNEGEKYITSLGHISACLIPWASVVTGPTGGEGPGSQA